METIDASCPEPGQDSRPLLVTLGDTGGLGQELAARYYADRETDQPLCLIGAETALAGACESLGITPFWKRVGDVAEIAGPGVHLLVPEGLENHVPSPGTPSPEGGRAAGLSLDLACDLLGDGRARGLVTLPLDKAMLHAAGFDFPGHTEFLAQRAGLDQDRVCMHLCGEILRVSLVTTHPALAEVPALITRERMLRTLWQTEQFVRCSGAFDADVADKPVAVCGLNPHAGERGRIGREEIEVIGPALEEARAAGMNAEGPLPADTVFHRAAKGEFAAVLAMYHDQGLGPLKTLHFGQAVNVTLGLPFVRTSVDHGTGYDLVGTGRADMTSLEAALRLAGRMRPVGQP